MFSDNLLDHVCQLFRAGAQVSSPGSLQRLTAAEAPKHRNARCPGVLCRLNVHLTVSHINAPIRPDGRHGPENHIRRRLPGASGDLTHGGDAGKIVGTQSLHGAVWLVGDDGQGIAFFQDPQCLRDARVGLGFDLTVGGVVGLIHFQQLGNGAFCRACGKTSAQLGLGTVSQGDAYLLTGSAGVAEPGQGVVGGIRQILQGIQQSAVQVKQDSGHVTSPNSSWPGCPLPGREPAGSCRSAGKPPGRNTAGKSPRCSDSWTGSWACRKGSGH